MYEAYVTSEYYINSYNGTAIPPDKLEKALKEASRHIDTLTYNRIAGKGINALTEFQQEIIKECVCELADFEAENEELIKCVLSQYSINGVSMSLGNSWNVHIQQGVVINKATYYWLTQTGLCCRSLGVHR